MPERSFRNGLLHLLLPVCSTRPVKFRNLLQWVCTGFALLLAGCATNNFATPIASFQKSVGTTSTAIGTAFNNLNDIQRQLYLDEVALDPERSISVQDPSGAPTPLLGRGFQAPSIKARLDSLTLLGTYAQQLTNLVGASPAQQLSEITQRTGSSLTSLDKTFAELSSNAYDPTAAKYINPVSQLIGALIKMYYDHRRDIAIRDAVNTGAPAVKEILDGLETDLAQFVKPRQTTDLNARLKILIAYYNDHRVEPDMNLQAREQLLDEISKCAAAYEASIEFNPSALIDSIRQAHNALLKYANAPKTPGSINELVSTLQALDENAQLVQKEVEQIRQGAKG